MIIGFLKDSSSGISPIVPVNVAKLKDLFEEVMIEAGIGKSSFFDDVDYEGAIVSDSKSIKQRSDVLVQIFVETDLKDIKEGAVVISQFAPFTDPSISENLQKQGINAISLDMIPRTSLAQSMDILSAMGSIAGYMSVLIAAELLPRYIPMMITAAGSIKPSKVLILGAGVAGLQAIATAKRIGGAVEAFDTRSAVREEVQSLGAKFVEVEGAKDEASAGGYAVEQSEEYKKKQGELIQDRARNADIVITTAQLRGKPAPVLITKETVEAMKPGSVIIDIATSTGGNCELSQDQKTITHKGITIVGDSNLAARLPQDASTLYSNSILNYLKHIVTNKSIDLNSEDEILSKSIISKKA